MTFEEFKELKAGDRIVAIGKTWFDTKAGDKGTKTVNMVLQLHLTRNT